MPWGYGFGGSGMWFGGLMMLLFWGGLIVLGYFLVRALIGAGQGGASSGHAAPSGSRALEILKERYARGEIAKEQYDQMRKDLSV